VISGHAGYPIVDFTLHGCTFCGACADACNAHCFDRSATAPWVLRAAIAASCVEARGVTCRMCLEACDASAIRFRPKLGGGATALVDDAACTGCGACVRICPVKAIAVTIPSRTPEIAS
jgi:ferredoxin-type protein NapF